MALDDDIALLRRLDFFNVFEADQLRLMLFAAERRVLRAHDTLFVRGEMADEGYVVLSGLIALLAEDNSVVEHARPGTLIGEYALLVPSERTTSAVVRDVTRVIVLPRKLIQRLLVEYPDVAVALRQKLAERAIHFSDALARIGQISD